MGMTATCAGCGHAESSDNHRGARLGACPQCGGQMRAHTVGKSRGRYRCPVTGWVFTLGMRYSVQLDQPMRLVFVPGWDTTDREPDPDRPGWLRPVRRHRAEPEQQELEYLERTGHLVLGPGCAVERPFAQPGPDGRHYGHADVYLTLGLTAAKVRTPGQADRWAMVVIAAHAQLLLARPLAADLRRPWEKHPDPGRPLSPGRVRRGFRNIHRDLGTPARVPKPSRPGPGRPKGSGNGPAPRYLLPGEADKPRTTNTSLTRQKVKT